MNNEFVQIRKKEEEQVYIYRIVFNTKGIPKTYMKQYLLKWAKLFSLQIEI